MPQPYSIQAPEDIAKEYAGNKAKIAEATQMGILDPTAAVLAGMFIDRMRNAQAQEMAQQPTVAQQVLAPPAPAPQAPPAGGLGATPPAMGMAPPPPGPEMGMAPPPPAPEMGVQPVPGMADGGLVGLGVPDYMFDEPDDGGYAGGGLVAFADGGKAVTPPKVDPYIAKIMGLRDQMMGQMQDPKETALMDKLYGQYEEQASDEAYNRARKEAMWETLAEFGFRMAGSSAPGGILGAISEAAAASLPGARASKKERKELRANALEKMVSLGNMKREAASKALDAALNVSKTAMEDEQFNKRLAFDREQAALGRANALTAARIGAAKSPDADILFLMDKIKRDNPNMTDTAALERAYFIRYGDRSKDTKNDGSPEGFGKNGSTAERVRLDPM